MFYNLHIQEVSGVDTISERFAHAAQKQIEEVAETDGTMKHIAKVADAVEEAVDEAPMAPTFKQSMLMAPCRVDRSGKP